MSSTSDRSEDNQELKEEKSCPVEDDYVPEGAKPRPQDRYPYGQIAPAFSGGKFAKNEALRRIFKHMTTAELITRRRVSREWRDLINLLLKESVKNVLLFSDRYNVRQYLYFLKKVGLEDDVNYKLSNFYPSYKTISLLVTDIELLATVKGLIGRFVLTTRLIYFGEPIVEDSRMTSPSWHIYLPNIVEMFGCLETLVVHHCGYFPGQNPFTTHPDIYKRLKRIYSVQPSAKELIRLKLLETGTSPQHLNVITTGKFNYRRGFHLDDQHPNMAINSANESRLAVAPGTIFFTHVIAKHIGSHAPKDTQKVLPLEDYFSSD